ncbi:MAG: DUF1003 domain-containing protein [Verrucomicrobiota bacterium]
MTIETLRQVPLFESLDTEAANKLCEFLVTRQCEPFKVLFRAGDAGDSMYLIEGGRVRISVQARDGHELTLAELGRGEFFGEMALLDGQPRSANATTLEESTLAVLSREHLLLFVERNPRFALEMLTAIANRLRRTDELLRHRATRNVNEEEAAGFTLADRAADMIAEFGGSWKFILTAIVFFNVWILINSWVLAKGFDVYPYLLLSTALNMVAALQAPIILMSQNRQTHKDRLRAEIDYQVNLKNELALNEILQRLRALEEDYLRLASKRNGQDS